MVPPGMTREELDRDIEELSGTWAAGDPKDAALRAACLERLARLRTLGDRLTEVARHRRTEPATLSRQVHGELDCTSRSSDKLRA